MASLGSSIRSAARATSSAYRRLPIRWRLAGGSAALTLVILCGFAAIVGVLTTQQIQRDFNREVADAADELSREARAAARRALRRRAGAAQGQRPEPRRLRGAADAVDAGHHAQRRLRDRQHRGAPTFGPAARDARRSTAGASSRAR